MLRGELDPATLPRHPPEEPRPQALPLLDHVVPIHPTSSPQALLEADRSMPPTSQPRFSIERAEDDYELINVEGAASNGKPTLRISQPFQMPYASRPVSREGSPNPLASLGVSGRNIPKAQRTPTRERHLFPSEDDLPDHNPSSPDGATFPALGHSRLHTSETMVDSPRRAGRDEYTTEVDTSGDEAADIASTHASYSMSNFKTRHRILPPKWKGKSVHKQGTPTSESEMDLPARPITQSDLTPHLQDVQLPARPTIVHNENAPVSNAASLTGTPRSSAFKLFGHAPEVPPPMPVLQSGSSEATVRPSQEQRRSMELGELERPIGMPHAEDGSKKVRFFDSGSHRTLRDRFLRRA